MLRTKRSRAAPGPAGQRLLRAAFHPGDGDYYPRLLWVTDVVREGPWITPVYQNPFHVISFVQSGHAELLAGDQTLELAPGSVGIYARGVPHQARSLPPHERYHTVILTFEVEPTPPLPSFFPVHVDRARALLTQVVQSVREMGPHPCQTPAITLMLLEILLLAQASSVAAEAPQERLVRLAKEAIDGSLAEPFSLIRLAATLELSPTRCNYLFTRTTGMSPRAYHRAQRVQVAKRMLVEDQASILATAEALGFDSIQHFSRFFSAETGQPPAAWRRHYLGQKNQPLMLPSEPLPLT